MEAKVKVKESEVSMLIIEVDNLRRGSHQLAEELSLANNQQHQELVRQRSLAVIHQPSP